MLSDYYETLFAENGPEGLALARRELPSLVLTDLVMPGLNGFAVCRELKSQAATAHIPVIILTARGELRHKLEGLESGADDYLPKPFNSRELLARIRSLLRNRALERELARKNRELEETLGELRRAQEKLLEGERLRTALAMAGALAHEVNNPLSGILGFCDLLKLTLGAGHRSLPDVEKVIQQSNRIAEVVRKIMALREVRFIAYVGDEKIVDIDSRPRP